MSHVLGLDLGTSYLKSVVVDREGCVRGMARVAAPDRVGGDGKWELEVDDFVDRLCELVLNACANGSVRLSEISGVSYASQTNTFLLLDDEMRLLTRLISWKDGRGRPLHDSLNTHASQSDFAAESGLGVFDDGFAIAKLPSIQRDSPDLWDRTGFFMTVSDYVASGLVGRAIGDSSTIGFTGLWNIRGEEVRESAIAALGMRTDMLSTHVRAGDLLGPATGWLSTRMGLPPSCTVTAGTLDHLAASVALRGETDGSQVVESSGTVLSAIRTTPAYAPRPGAVVGLDVDPRSYFELVFSTNGATCLDWYRSFHASNRSLDDLLGLAESIQPGCGGVRAREQPETYDGLSGFLVPEGLQPSHGHYVRAMLEGVARSLRDLVQRQGAAWAQGPIVSAGGGSRSDLWMKIKADITNRSIVRYTVPEPAAYGAAVLASVGAGWFGSAGASASAWSSPIETVNPDPARLAEP